MPAINAINIVNELYRLLTSGGTMNGFDVSFPESKLERQIMVNQNTWGYSWQEPDGPEPYLEEYKFGILLTDTLEAVGLTNVENIESYLNYVNIKYE